MEQPTGLDNLAGENAVMIASETLIPFFAIVITLLLTPGPAVMFVITRSVQFGYHAGLMATVGLCLGGFVHVLLSVIGVSAIIAASPQLFNAVKFTGAAYLVYLGIKAMKQPRLVEENAGGVKRGCFKDGFIISILNPKTALFFLAFLPQFVNSKSGPVSLQLIVLGGIYVGLALLTDSLYALAASSSRRFIHANPALLSSLPFVSGIIYVGLGATLLFLGARS